MSAAGSHSFEPTDRAERLVSSLDETLNTLAAVGAPPRRLAELARFCHAALEGLGPELAQRGTSRENLSVPRMRGGDPASEPLLAFLCALRALSRAKIEFLRATQLAGTAGDDRSMRGVELIGVAERFAWCARLPSVVCVAGLAASGKSTVAGALAAAAGRSVVSSDRVRTRRAGLDPDERAVHSSYGDEESRAVYVELAQCAADAADRDGGVIVDATFRRTSDVDAFAAAAPITSAAEWVVCEAPPAVLIQRAHAREVAGADPGSGPSVVAAELAGHRGRFVAPVAPLVRLDTTRPVPDLLSDLAGVLDARLARQITDEGTPS
ncbi:ATP-binding protein [Solirubrobacter ginsenosidimutans]|uniref:ATP-binding protein n=1 Tax=Solirubrobacter ginsenosidimutans TaxID=490573 RepID=A0A9X3S1C5_9ACTN|nr:AAA family ATPase [Solirubrobacter ginsenosidimutans]MDA0163245.1 ATP-binding protein [Solirubrobacter ginsenosidimutans]